MTSRMVTSDSVVALQTSLTDGEVGYVDAEWISPRQTLPLRALVVTGTDDPDGDAVRALSSLAVAATAVVRGDVHGSVLVTGSGLVARFARALLGHRLLEEVARTRPRAIVETTGDPRMIETATRLVSDLGVIALAGEPRGRVVDLDLYPNVHVRGLQLIGVAPIGPGQGADPPLAAPPPATLSGGEQIFSADWYRCSAQLR